MSLQIARGMLYCTTCGSQGTPEFHYLTLPRHPFILPALVIRLRFGSLRYEFVYDECRYWDNNMFFCHGVNFIMTQYVRYKSLFQRQDDDKTGLIINTLTCKLFSKSFRYLLYLYQVYYRLFVFQCSSLISCAVDPGFRSCF